jgi:hypothetical protein
MGKIRILPYRRAQRAMAVMAVALCALLVSAEGVLSQEPAPLRSAIVRVTVVGTDGAGLADVNLAISRSDVGAILSGLTNGSGMHSFQVAILPGAYSLLARRPGFAPAETALDFGKSDTVLVVLRLQATPATQLAAVVVEASRSNYVLDGFQIAASGRPIRDAFEALRKLRPYMLFDGDRCRHEVVDNVWINGRRVLFMASQVPVFGARSVRTVGGTRVSTSGGEPPAIDSVLASIRAAHVEEIRLANCWDTSLPGVGSNNALYVTLKPGIDWDWKRGSFAVDTIPER